MPCHHIIIAFIIGTVHFIQTIEIETAKIDVVDDVICDIAQRYQITKQTRNCEIHNSVFKAVANCNYNKYKKPEWLGELPSETRLNAIWPNKASFVERENKMTHKYHNDAHDDECLCRPHTYIV